MKKNKKTHLLLFIFTLLLLSGKSVSAAETTSDGLWRYEVNEETITLTSYEGTASNVTIPDSIEGKKVTKLAKNCFEGNYSIQNVTIPATVKSVEGYAFIDCGNLKTVTFSGMSTHVDNDFARQCGDNVKVYCYLYSATYYDITYDYPMEYLGIHITFDKTSYSADVGETFTLHATLNNTEATPTLTWSSSDSTVATVSASGKVTAKKPGKTYITASAEIDGDTIISEQCTITVETPSLTFTSYQAYRGDKFILTATNIRAGLLSWSSSNQKVATVKNGKVSAKKKGKVTIRAKYGDTTLSCKVTVLNPSFSTKYCGLTEGFTFTPGINGGNDKKIVWKSSNPKIATVNKNGKITGKTVGTCKITAKISGITTKCTIYVMPNIYEVDKKAKLSQYSQGTIHYQLQKAYFSGDNLIIKVKFFNRTDNTYKRLSYMSFHLSYENKTYLSKSVYNKRFLLKSHSAKTLTFCLSGKKIKKTVDLRNATWKCNTGLLYTN